MSHPRPDIATRYVSPGSQMEHVVAELWHEVLGVEHLGAHDNFFELGGDSLLLMQLISRLRARFQIELPLRAIFETPTVTAIAQLIEQAKSMPAPVPPPIRRLPRESLTVRTP